MAFPQIRDKTLTHRRVTLPDDFDCRLNVVFIAFRRPQQVQISAWLPAIKRLEQLYEDLCVYAIPVIQRLPCPLQAFVDARLRASIPSKTVRARTVTLYTDKETFRRTLDIPTDDTIHILLVDRKGRIWWRAEGDFSADKIRSLAQAIEHAHTTG